MLSHKTMLMRNTPETSNQQPATGPLPRHIAIIMDGNGRWAKARGLPRTMGHHEGAEALKRVMESCLELGVAHLTVYAFSSENWKRPGGEIRDLMGLLRRYLEHEAEALNRHGVRMKAIGDLSRLDGDIQASIHRAEALTAGNTALNLYVALSYGARQEMAAAAKRQAEAVQQGRLTADAITEDTLQQFLSTADIPDPDLLIRTGGEHRLSNFLLWQCAYTELYFSPVLWPDFGKAGLMEALADYAGRERRFGASDGK